MSTPSSTVSGLTKFNPDEAWINQFTPEEKAVLTEYSKYRWIEHSKTLALDSLRSRHSCFDQWKLHLTGLEETVKPTLLRILIANTKSITDPYTRCQEIAETISILCGRVSTLSIQLPGRPYPTTIGVISDALTSAASYKKDLTKSLKEKADLNSFEFQLVTIYSTIRNKFPLSSSKLNSHYGVIIDAAFKEKLNLKLTGWRFAVVGDQKVLFLIAEPHINTLQSLVCKKLAELHFPLAEQLPYDYQVKTGYLQAAQRILEGGTRVSLDQQKEVITAQLVY